MSKVLTQAKNRYQKAIIIESVCLVVFGVFLAIWQGESAVDFSLGFISAFVPFCAFAYIVFFRKQDFSTKLKAFYLAEVVKFLFTILLVTFAYIPALIVAYNLGVADLVNTWPVEWSLGRFIVYFVGNE